MKLFLSHSSSDKDLFAKKIADSLGNFVIYDEYTFEEGMKTFDEIKIHLENNTNLFVILLSDKALNSKWVQEELSIAYRELGNKIQRIYPIIIDKKINHEDYRIPGWLKDNYNIRLILKVGKIISLLKRRLRELKWENNEFFKKQENIFIGRNNQTKFVEDRVFNIDKPIPRVIFASGLPKIGKKSFLKYVIKKTQSQYKGAYEFPKIFLDSTNSIEDFILYVDDLEFTENHIQRDSLNILKKRDKVLIAVNLLRELNKTKELLLIEDNGSIITHEGYITEWFQDIIKELINEREDIFIVVSSRFGTFKHNYSIEDYILKVKIDELEINERVGLLLEYIKVYELEHKIDREQIKILSGLLKGYPEQIAYVIHKLKETSYHEIMKESNDIIEYNDDKIYSIIKEFPEGTDEFDLLVLLSHIDMISYELLDSIFDKDKSDTYYKILDKFFIYSICERFGTQNEYFRINDVIKNHICRLKHNLPSVFLDNLKNNLTKFLEENKFEDANLSDFFYYINQALIQGKEVPDKYLLPSHFLKTITQLYNSQDYDTLINIAKKILNKKEYIDPFIIFEIRHYLCSAYARKRDNKFFDEVQFVDNQAEQCFLKGFYYRLQGKFQKSIEWYKKAIELNKKFSRANREIVQVYLNVYDFDKAYTQSKINYKQWSNNVYHIHAYCISIFYQEKNNNNIPLLKELIKKLELSQYNYRAKQMYHECSALYYTYYEDNFEKAISIINNSIKEFPSSMYPLFSKFDILEYFKKKELLEDMINKIHSHLKYYDNTSYILPSIEVRDIGFLISKGKKEMALNKLKKLQETTGYNFEYIKYKYDL